MSIKLIESFSWIDNTAAGKAAFNTRYNNSGTLYNIQVGGGRFAGNALKLAGDAWFFQFPNGAMGPDIVFGFAMNCPSPVAGTAAEIFTLTFTSAGNNEQVSLRYDGNARINITRQGNVLVTGTQVIALNTWYYIEFAVHLDPVNGSGKVWINGVVDSQVTGVNTQPQAAATAIEGKLGNQGNPFYCDMYGMDGTLVNLGPRRVSLKLPTSNGTDQNWTPSAGNAFACVNTVPPNGDANGFISSNTPGDLSTFNFGALPYAPASVDAVQVSLYTRFDDGGPHQVAALALSGGTLGTGATKSIAASYLDSYLEVYATDPNTAAPWTAANVDLAQFGVKLVL